MYRKILVTVSLLIVATAGFAQRYRPFGGALNIYSTDVPFFLYINNVLYNNRASTDIRVPNLTSRRYDLRIVFADRQQRTLNGSGVQLVNRNGQYMNVVFSVSSRRGNRGIILESMNPVDRYNNGNYREDLPYTNRDGYRNEQGMIDTDNQKIVTICQTIIVKDITKDGIMIDIGNQETIRFIATV